MSELSTQTIQGPAGPGPVRIGALARLTAEIGQHDEGRNWGPFVQRIAAPFLSVDRLASYAPGGERAGKLLWCALAVSWAFYDELRGRGHDQLAQQWRNIASASCDTLRERLDAHGWVWAPGDPLPAALCPQDADAEGLPGTGDIVFYGDRRDDIKHVDLFEGGVVGGFSSVGGNSGPKADRVARVEHAGAKLKRVQLYARVPW